MTACTPEHRICGGPAHRCHQQTPGGVLSCTRTEGHAGDHVTCMTLGGRHNLRTWPQEDQP